MNLNENYMYLFEDTLLEDLDRRQKRKWKIILLSIKYVDIKSYKEAYPEDKDLSRKQIVKKLRDKLNRLPEESKLKLLNNKNVVEADNKLEKRGKGNGPIIAGAATTTGGIATGGSIAVGASAAAAGLIGTIEAGTPEALLLIWVLVPVIGLLGIIAIGGAALAAIGIGIGSGLMIKGAHTKKVNKKIVKMMPNTEIIADIKKEEQALKKEIGDPKKLKIVSSQEEQIKKLTPKLA